MNDRRATSQNEVARPVYNGMKYTYYENKALNRLNGVAHCLGLAVQSTAWDPDTHTATFMLGADAAQCKRFIAAASLGVRKAQYALIPGGVRIKFLATVARKRTPSGTHA